MSYPCCVCKKDILNPHFSFERRFEKISAGLHEGKQVTQINIENCEILLMYCSKTCWESHQSYVAGILELWQTFPPFGLFTPCSRCGDPVSRTQLHVCYSISQIMLEGPAGAAGRSLDDDDFAVLCKDCYPPEYKQEEMVVERDVAREEFTI